jgi:hypothetical protein
MPKGEITAESVIARFESLRDLAACDWRLVVKIERLLWHVRRRQRQLATGECSKHEPAVEEVIRGCERTAALAERLGRHDSAARSLAMMHTLQQLQLRLAVAERACEPLLH